MLHFADSLYEVGHCGNCDWMLNLAYYRDALELRPGEADLAEASTPKFFACGLLVGAGAMDTLRITIDDLARSEIAAFLSDHIAEMRSVTSPESKHALDLDGLRSPEITFWTVSGEGGALVGCGALKRLDGSHAEIKSMRVSPGHRKRGIASTLLRHLLSEAERREFSRVSLETGSSEFFEPARRLYLAHGFEVCGPFGDYKADPNSAFMTRVVSNPIAGLLPPRQ